MEIVLPFRKAHRRCPVRFDRDSISICVFYRHKHIVLFDIDRESDTAQLLCLCVCFIFSPGLLLQADLLIRRVLKSEDQVFLLHFRAIFFDDLEVPVLHYDMPARSINALRLCVLVVSCRDFCLRDGVFMAEIDLRVNCIGILSRYSLFLSVFIGNLKCGAGKLRTVAELVLLDDPDPDLLFDVVSHRSQRTAALRRKGADTESVSLCSANCDLGICDPGVSRVRVLFHYIVGVDPSSCVCRDKTAEGQLAVCIGGSGVDSLCSICSGCDAVKPELFVAPVSFCIRAGNNVQLRFLFGQLDKTAPAVLHDNFVLRIRDGPVGRYDLIGVSLVAPVSGISVKVKIVARDRLHKAVFELSVLRIILGYLDGSSAFIVDAVGAHILPFCPSCPRFVQSCAALQHKCVRELPVVVCHVLEIVGIRNRAVLLQEKDFLRVQVVCDLHCRVRNVVGRDRNFLYFLGFDVALRRRDLPQIVSSGYKSLKRRIPAVVCRRGERISCCIPDRLCMVTVRIQTENSPRHRQRVIGVVCLVDLDLPQFLFVVK